MRRRADLLAIPEAERFHEILDGELLRRAIPSWRHGGAQVRRSTRPGGPYDRRPGRGRPGGWRFATDLVRSTQPDTDGERGDGILSTIPSRVHRSPTPAHRCHRARSGSSRSLSHPRRARTRRRTLAR
ncbi:uncharacterized protein SOCEGT47_080630 [Sorangium cellulosum]|uniref:Uncharacterized protein n=1 Tax=Sorangium cellulosum TaxID=56 RepID=A0A4V0NEV3_SORCE|nr:uncharacterized protein SOCEGT47_080630 [Sorangium cellulosum]